MLQVRIQKRLGGFQLNIAFETGAEVMGLLGASGCGKSMTLKCIAGILTPDTGRIVLNGRVLFDSQQRINLCPQERRVGYLFQQYALFPNMTARQNILAGCREKDKALGQKQVDDMMRAMQLIHLANQKPAELSGGQQQRVALARILINQPELLLLDEPLSALDSYLRWQMENELADTIRAFSAGTLLVSHSREEVYRLCDTVCVINKGKSEPKQTVRQLFQQPQTLSACLLSGCKNFSRARPAGKHSIQAVDWGVTLHLPQDTPTDRPLIGVRAHYIRLSALPPEQPGTFPSKVLRVTDDVFSTVLTLATPGGDSGYAALRVDLPKEQWAALQGAVTLYATIRPEDIMVLHS